MPDPITLTSPDSPLSLVLDPTTGLPTRLALHTEDGEVTRDLRCSLTATTGGVEHRGPTGGLAYRDTDLHTDLALAGTPARRTHRGVSDDHTLDATLGPLSVQLTHRLFPTSPYVEVMAHLASPEQETVVRNVDLVVEVIGDPTTMALHAPGNPVRRGLPVSELGGALGVSPLGGLRGSSGIVATVADGHVTTVWPTQDAEIPDIAVTCLDDGMRVHVRTNFAAALDPTTSADLVLTSLDVHPGDHDTLVAQWPAWATRHGLTSPGPKPDWSAAASIYEVQIGTSHFWGGNSYCAYPEVRDLIADLDRVQDLGFSVIQLMPRQPYPSYNVHDYADVTISYGNEDEVRELVRLAHERGMKVILDILLHGVLDNESVDMALAGIAEGPYADRLDEETRDSFAADLSDNSNYMIAWSRHIHDFAEHWKGGSPVHSPLIEEHPDWFFRDSAGNVTGVYTKAFDARSPSWQQYFRESAVNLVRTLDVDGFRFDAPTYNDFPNWAPWARARASASSLGCLPLFDDLRRDLKALKPDALMYTEPSGHLLRRSMDLTYNYDEQWLVTALAVPDRVHPRGVTSGADFMAWMHDRDTFLPAGSMTAHHIDSHDTFWWPQWGAKWRREQFGIDITRALAMVFLALDGPTMMFTGGEEGLEDELRLVNGLRREHPEWWDQQGTFLTDGDPGLVAIVRGQGPDQLAVVVNATGTAAVPLPASLGEGWTTLASVGYEDDGSGAGQLAPHGYWVATLS